MRSASWCPQTGQVRVESRMTACFAMAGFYNAGYPAGPGPGSQILQQGSGLRPKWLRKAWLKWLWLLKPRIQREFRQALPIFRQLLQCRSKTQLREVLVQGAAGGLAERATEAEG